MKRKIRALVASTLLVGILAGCGGQTQPSSQPSAAPAASPSTQPTATQEGSYPTVTTADVQAALTDTNSVVVDARINSAYIGWTLEGVERGGHIPGATDFSARWLTSTYSDTDNLEGETRAQVLEQYLVDKGIDSSKKVIVYDANGTDAVAVADYFASQGVTDISLYDVNEWAADESLEMESYPNYSLLVPAENVKALIDGQTPETFETGVEYKFFNVAWGEVDQSGYLDGHVPGAVHVNTDWFEPPSDNGWMLADDETLLALMLRLGITAGDHIVVTGPEPMAACRFAVILKYMGVDDVRVMTGGLVEWSDLGYELATDNVEPVAVESFGVDTPANPDWIDTIEEVQDLLTQDNFTLVDNRTWEEFIGESTGYSYHDKAGRIPGAVFGYAGKVSSSSVCYYRNIDKTMRNADEILAMWEGCGIDPSNHLSFMCGSGWRAAEILWYARVMGYENTSLYSDGWIGWSNAGLPSETGDPTAN